MADSLLGLRYASYWLSQRLPRVVWVQPSPSTRLTGWASPQYMPLQLVLTILVAKRSAGPWEPNHLSGLDISLRYAKRGFVLSRKLDKSWRSCLSVVKKAVSNRPVTPCYCRRVARPPRSTLDRKLRAGTAEVSGDRSQPIGDVAPLRHSTPQDYVWN